MRTVYAVITIAALLGSVPVRADELLAPGRPAGVRPAQASDMINIYGGVALYAGLLFALIGTTGDPGTVATATSTG